MHHNIREAGSLTYILEIKASAEDLALDVQQAVRKRRSVSNLKGFRPGKVPHHWIKRVYKRELEEEITKSIVEEAYEDLVTASDQYDVMGDPRPVTFEYDLDSDLHIELEFVTRPSVGLRDIPEELLEYKILVVTDELVDQTAKLILERQARMRPLEEGESIGEEGAGEQDAVKCETIEVDPATGVVLIGASKSGMEVELGEPAYEDDPEYVALCNALTGASAGDQVLVKFTEAPSPGVVDALPVERAYRANVMEAKRRHVPELDDTLVREISSNCVSTVDQWQNALSEMIGFALQVWNTNQRDKAVITRMVEVQDITVPEGMVRRSQDEYRDTVGGEHDEAARADYFRENYAWHFIREEMLKQEMFEWPPEPDDLSDIYSSRDLNALQIFEQFFSSVPSYQAEPTQERCALDYLADEFDVTDVEESSDGAAAMLAMVVERAWSALPALEKAEVAALEDSGEPALAVE